MSIITTIVGSASVQPAIAVAFALSLVLSSLAFYRLYLSPIAHIPGPLLARLTYWYQFYYDVFPRQGQYTFKIQRLHEQYGPIVRINPEEVHFSDPDFYDVIYAGGSQRRDKWFAFCAEFGITGAGFATAKHDLHRLRRASMNPFFSLAKIRKLQPRIETIVDKLLERLDQFRRTGQPMNISLAFAALTNDIISHYCFGRCDNRIEIEDFDPTRHEAFVNGSALSHFFFHIPWPLPLLQSLPGSVVVMLNSGMRSYLKMQRDMRKEITRIQQSHGTDTGHEKSDESTVFHSILDSDLPASEKSISRLAQEGQALTGAGTETTAGALAWATYYLLSHPSDLLRLKQELRREIEDMDSHPPLATIENLPFLTACIKEAVRLNNGVSSRLQRISPDQPITFSTDSKQYVLPPGTPMSMTGMLVHSDPTIFPEPNEFKPQRWLDDPRLVKYLVAFSKGTRQCIGINLAYAEMYLTLAAIFRRYGSREVRMEDDVGFLELYETDQRDVEIVTDLFLPFVYPQSKGIRVIVRE